MGGSAVSENDPIHEVARARSATIQGLRFIHAALGLDGVRDVLMETGCLVPLFDAFVDGVKAARELRDSVHEGATP